MQVFQASLPPTMHIPCEFIELFNWIESVSGIGKSISGEQYAVIDPRQIGRRGGSCVFFYETSTDQHWLGSDDAKKISRLRPFMQTGGDGSAAAFWLDDQGKQRIVHLGSGSGSIMVGTWVRSPLEFLTLLAIGYEELCWSDEYDKKPIDCDVDKDRFLEPTLYRQWLVDTYGVVIPPTAEKLVNDMSKLGEPSDDPFCLWLKSVDSNK